MRSRGFTLLELLVVIAILGLTMGLVASSSMGPSPGLVDRDAVASLVQGLRQARTKAIMQGRANEFALDLAAKRWTLTDGGATALPQRLAITMASAANETRGNRVGAIVFLPDGSSTGGRIDLVDAGTSWRISVDWLTGRVSVDRGG